MTIPWPTLEQQIEELDADKPVSGRQIWFWLTVSKYIIGDFLIKVGVVSFVVLASPVIVGMAIWRAFR